MKKFVLIIAIIIFIASLCIVSLYMDNKTNSIINEPTISSGEISLSGEKDEIVGESSSGEIENKIESNREVIEITKEEFEEKVLNSSKKVLVDFYADWCGPCQILSPLVEEVAQEYEDVEFYKINVDYANDIANKYEIFKIPNLIVFENGEIVNQSIGAIPKEQIIDLIK